LANHVNGTSAECKAERNVLRDIVRISVKPLKVGKLDIGDYQTKYNWEFILFESLLNSWAWLNPFQFKMNLFTTYKDWPYLLESCVFENIAYLPWSPLSSGMLSGKYIGGARPES